MNTEGGKVKQNTNQFSFPWMKGHNINQSLWKIPFFMLNAWRLQVTRLIVYRDWRFDKNLQFLIQLNTFKYIDLRLIHMNTKGWTDIFVLGELYLQTCVPSSSNNAEQ